MPHLDTRARQHPPSSDGFTCPGCPQGSRGASCDACPAQHAPELTPSHDAALAPACAFQAGGSVTRTADAAQRPPGHVSHGTAGSRWAELLRASRLSGRVRGRAPSRAVPRRPSSASCRPSAGLRRAQTPPSVSGSSGSSTREPFCCTGVASLGRCELLVAGWPLGGSRGWPLACAVLPLLSGSSS